MFCDGGLGNEVYIVVHGDGLKGCVLVFFPVGRRGKIFLLRIPF